jgi:hypothetical protein
MRKDIVLAVLLVLVFLFGCAPPLPAPAYMAAPPWITCGYPPQPGATCDAVTEI